MASQPKTKQRREPSRDPDDMDFFNLYQDIKMEIMVIGDGGMEMEFDLIGAFPSLANALRRTLLVEVPSMAPETVMLQQNQSAIPDEVLGHRIGLIPFKADPRKFKFRPIDSKSDHPQFALIYEMKVIAPKQNLKTEKRFHSTRIYSRDFKWIRHPSQKDITDDSQLRPVFDDILLNVLRPNQEMDFRVHVVKGIGKDHTKFSPVSIATYRQLPVIRLLRPVLDDEAETLQQCFSKGVINVKKHKDGSKEAVVSDARLDSNSRNVFRDARLKKAVEIGLKDDHFIFSVESIGAMAVSVLVKEALNILKERCEYHRLSIGYQQREVEIIDTQE